MKTRNPSRSPARILALAALSGLLVLTGVELGGCKHKLGSRLGQRMGKGGIRSRLVANNRATMIAIHGEPVVAGRFTAMDVENQNGSITIICSDRYSEATIEARIPSGDRKELESWGLDATDKDNWVIAEHDSGADRSILRVTTLNGPLENGFQPRVDLIIKSPVCDGLLVRSAGGSVDVTGARGAITIESGFAGAAGGRVEVRTAEPIVEPVRITSSIGPVYLVVPPESRGTIDIESDNGMAVFNTSHGRVVNVQPTRDRWTGVWNEGENQIQLYAGSGDARMMVVEKPVTYSTGSGLAPLLD